MTRTKIAVLGGGVGAMTTAFHLTSVSGWRERYDVTVYPIGWAPRGQRAGGRVVAPTRPLGPGGGGRRSRRAVAVRVPGQRRRSRPGRRAADAVAGPADPARLGARGVRADQRGAGAGDVD